MSIYEFSYFIANILNISEDLMNSRIFSYKVQRMFVILLIDKSKTWLKNIPTENLVNLTTYV
ncbi:hypothetical protein NIES22_25520 [Calothrix brevissima NIES-22]|nr:hypothetical protein NIES22_25520 [Calothrix brevissima NIES-22]